MIADFRRRFWVSLALTVPVVAISPMTQRMFGLGHALAFPGGRFVLLILSSVIFFYGGQPFLRGLFDELRKRRPGMMTLIALAISVAYFYSAAVVLGLPGEDFFWELATLIDIMLLGHWIEMRSVLGASRADDLLRLAASLESRSEHPIAAGVVRAAAEKKLPLPEAADFRAIPGKGAEARIEGRNVKVVSPGFLTEQKLAIDDERVRKTADEGKTVVFVIVDGRVEGALALADVIREESREGLKRLKELGIQAMMLTGDSKAVARWVASELALDDVFAEVLPHEKAAKVKEVKARGLVTAMTGDGVNDAPALVEADVGIAIGAGTDVAIESADIVLVRSDPRDVPAVVVLARATYRKMLQNLWWATGYNVIAIPLAAGVLYDRGILLSPALGAVFMSLSTVIVAVNAQLLSRVRSRLLR